MADHFSNRSGFPTLSLDVEQTSGCDSWSLSFGLFFQMIFFWFMAERICPLVCGHRADPMVFCVSFWRQLSRKTDITEQMLKVLALRPSFLALSPVAQLGGNSAQTHLISPLYVPRWPRLGPWCWLKWGDNLVPDWTVRAVWNLFAKI